MIRRALIFGGMFFLGFAIPVFAQTGTLKAPDPKIVIPFKGMIDFKAASAQIEIGRPEGKRKFVVDGARTGRGVYHLRMDISHVPLPFIDVASKVEGDIKILGDDPRAREFAGDFSSSLMLLNYMPFRDARIRFSVRDRKFIVESLWAGGLSAKGEIQLTGKRQLNMDVEVVAVDIEEFSSIIRAIGGKSDPTSLMFSGVMKGNLNLSGAWPRPYVRGRLSAYNGRVNKFDYDTISMDIDGQYPLLNINEALITQAQGLSFRLAGKLDVSDRVGLPAQFRLLKKLPLIASNDNRREWVFKRTQSSDDMRTEMKYLFMKDDRGDTEAVFGVQKSIGF